MRSVSSFLLFSVGLISTAAIAQDEDKQRTAAQVFGAVPAVYDISLSPDGTKVAFIAPGPGTMTDLFAIDLNQAQSNPKRVTRASGDPENLQWCNWVSNERMACKLGGIEKNSGDLYGFSRMVAINSDGSNPVLLSKRHDSTALGLSLSGGQVIDWLPGEENQVLMTRYHLEEVRIGSRVGNKDEGLAVEKIDTLTGRTKFVERPTEEAVEFITDGQGNVRIKGMRTKLGRTELDSGEIKYFYETDGKWDALSEYDYSNRTGFEPYAVEKDKNRALGFAPYNGRQALIAKSLDGTGRQEVIFSDDLVDIDGLIRIGRANRVVGVSYAKEKRVSEYFDTELASLASALSKALGGSKSINFVDSSQDESKLLLLATSDIDPGQYYLFDRTGKQLRPLLGIRPLVESQKLATVKPVVYSAADGTKIPAYLTLPPQGPVKNIPAIVMPHGGPEARDEWGFDWLAQFFASQGFAVIQPNFRGSTGYGDAWYQKNGYKGWKTAIGDVTDAGRWLVAEGIAKPSALSIVGWSYGGYAALQSAVVAPDLFKAVVAIAPVTDLSQHKSDSRGYYSSAVQRERIGNGPHIAEGSPAQNVDKIKAPVLMFHGDYDQNVDVTQSRLMESKLKGAGKSVTYYEYPKLAHGLHDARVRAEMLQKSLDFLPK
ncbi:S9 family peptidase [Parasphingorhabdus sp.]|uniref:alpha/beta hydrolase family protein n=1 Tax=Parasphingorhabdus sp. TaxID=2709688 RepID=UPI002B268921|nr:S9 family peptidase [Parasphingorhabdus sp.]